MGVSSPEFLGIGKKEAVVGEVMEKLRLHHKDTKSVGCGYSLRAILSWGGGPHERMAGDCYMRMEAVVYITQALCKSTQ